ncbi:hypothetical protein [Moorena sp. SIO3B2]|uniref:hypothetical protein n=1 Tax=Moorena sp. SIO3B2 TaxID=2607827 RepID=UPI0013C9BE87|nr:hypothetical protein [Moorena sp. SIO3B2]NEP31104.1 hypothetical protein [Moorena sp. SIO3B2]
MSLLLVEEGNRESGIGNRNPPLTPPRRGTGIGNRESEGSLARWADGETHEQGFWFPRGLQGGDTGDPHSSS